MVDTSLSISVSRLQQQQQYQCKRTQQEYEGVLLDASALQAAYLVAGGIGAPGKEIEEAGHHMTVPPGNGAADAAEDDAVGDELVDQMCIRDRFRVGGDGSNASWNNYDGNFQSSIVSNSTNMYEVWDGM